MILNELFQLTESSDELKDLMALSAFVAKAFLSDPVRNFWESNKSYTYDIAYLEMTSRIRAPKLLTEMVKNIVFRSNPNRIHFTVEHPKLVYRNAYAVYYPNLNMIDLSINKILANKKNLAITILHELQHVIDNSKSKGNNVPSSQRDASLVDMDSYLKMPSELNARFSEAMYDLAGKEVIPKNKMYDTIVEVLKKHNINKSLVTNKLFNNFVKRAYLFSVEIKNIGPYKDYTFSEKVKKIIQKYLFR